nr:unnamed protein product [Digitaria exilis]
MLRGGPAEVGSWRLSLCSLSVAQARAAAQQQARTAALWWSAATFELLVADLLRAVGATGASAGWGVGPAPHRPVEGLLYLRLV